MEEERVGPTALDRQLLTELDADRAALDGQLVAVVGYGNLGRPAALNLRDSGLSVVVGNRDDACGRLAKEEGFEVHPVEEALSQADVICLAVPDEVIPQVLSAERPRRGSLVCLASGYCLAYGLVRLPGDVDVAMLAPRMVGSAIRSLYEQGLGFYSFVSVEQDVTTTARRRLLALASALGTLRCGAVELPAATEAALDLFVEQTLGPYLGAAVLSAFEVGVAGGLPPEGLVLELYLSGEMARTWQMFADEGFFSGVKRHGYAAAFGGLARLGDIDVESMKRGFAATLESISRGRFARDLQDDLLAGSPRRSVIEAMTSGEDPLSRAETGVRGSGNGLGKS